MSVIRFVPPCFRTTVISLKAVIPGRELFQREGERESWSVTMHVDLSTSGGFSPIMQRHSSNQLRQGRAFLSDAARFVRFPGHTDRSSILLSLRSGSIAIFKNSIRSSRRVNLLLLRYKYRKYYRLIFLLLRIETISKLVSIFSFLLSTEIVKINQ